ncbi:MAG: right-handed parallel beta-helix repeat-containing protein [Puniceicoccaceae bacterium]
MKFLPFLIILFSSLNVSGFYISSSSGDDSNSGLTPNEPWASFSNLLSRDLLPGETVYLKRGDTWANSKLELRGKGTPESPIRLTAYGEGPPPVITGINLVDQACVVWNNPSHVRIDSLHCRDAKIGIYLRFAGGNSDGTGEMFNNQDVHITNCYFENMDEKWSNDEGEIAVVPPYEMSWGAGIWLGGSIPGFGGVPSPAEQSLILNDFSVTHCGFKDVNTGLGNGFYHPFEHRSRFTNLRFEDSWVIGCENGSFALFFVDGGHIQRVDTWLGGNEYYRTGTTGAFLQNCLNVIVEDCQFAGNLRPGDSNDGIGFDWEGHSDNMILRDSVIHDNEGAGILVLNSGGWNHNLTLERLTLWNNCRFPKPGSASQNSELRYAGNPSPPDPPTYGTLTNVGVYLGTDVGVDDAAGRLSVTDRPENWADDWKPTNFRIDQTWADVSGRPTQWSFDSSLEGWGNQKDWDLFSASGGAIIGQSSGLDAYVESSATWVNTRESRWVRVLMSSTSGKVAQIFFQTETDPSFSADKSVAFDVIDDGVMREYVIDMGDCPKYLGVVTKWRIDPTLEVGSILEISEFAAEKNPYLLSATPVSSSSIDLKFNQAMHLTGGVLDPANYTLSGLGKGSVSVNPDTVSLLSTEDGPVYRLTWNSGTMNGLELDVQASNALDPRGNALWSGSSKSIVSIPQAITDGDLDKMDDSWELANGLNPGNSLDATVDSDLDGISNLDEYLSGTDPKDPQSRFTIFEFQPQPGGQIEVTWASTPGMAYRIERSQDMVTWTEDEGGLVASQGTQTSVLLGSTQVRLFVRILTVRPNPLLD